MKFHELCELFPLMQQSELKDLAADIKQNGLREPILLLDGKILDGRNRFKACQLARVKPTFKPFRGDGAQLVASLNLKRRHLNESQRATIAADLATLEHGQKKADGNGGMTAKEAARATNVSLGSVKRARVVKAKGSRRVKQAVKQGKLRVATAAQIATLPKRKQDQIMERGERHAKQVAAQMSKAQAKDVRGRIIEALDAWWLKRKEHMDGTKPDELIDEVRDVIKAVAL
jgi:ParB-like chromosome segregation protein Spo0J